MRACFESDEPFRLADLPGELDAEGRLVLVRRLVREGFLRIRLTTRCAVTRTRRARRGSAESHVRYAGSSASDRGDVELVDRRVRRAEADAPRRRLPRAEPRKRRDRRSEEPFGLAQRLLGRLHRERVGAAPAVAVEVDASRRRRREQRARVAGADAPVVEAVREHDDVAGEAVAADVRRLPDAARVGLVPQRVVERPPVQRAAAVALAVRADEEERPLDRACRERRRRRAPPRSRVEQVVVVLDLELEEPLLAGRRACRRTRGARVRAALRLLDEQEPRVRERRELPAQVLLQLRREQAPAERRRAPTRPRYSTRIQWSTRLAVAASGSPPALETAAQNARLVSSALGRALTTATNLR